MHPSLVVCMLAERSREGPQLQLPPPLPVVPHNHFADVLAKQAMPTSQLRMACASIVRGRQEVRTIWGSIQEAAALLDVLHVFPSSTVHEVGLCMLDPRQWSVQPDALPPIGASPDGLIYHPPCAHCADYADVGTSDPACTYCNGLALPGQWEVCEVKNHCPFVRGVRHPRLQQ
jgi:hypothetical protein